jgi:hypothetical protein
MLGNFQDVGKINFEYKMAFELINVFLRLLIAFNIMEKQCKMDLSIIVRAFHLFTTPTLCIARR